MEGISHELLTAATEDMEQRAGMLDEAQQLIHHTGL